MTSYQITARSQNALARRDHAACHLSSAAHASPRPASTATTLRIMDVEHGRPLRSAV